MSISNNRLRFQRELARLRRRAGAGDTSAMCNLSMWLRDGAQDKRGRVILRRNRAASFALSERAALRGDATGAFLLGCAHHDGIGTKPNRRLALLWYRRAARAGQSVAASNIASIYRNDRKFRLAFRWWKRASAMDDGDAAVDVGYCYLYGIGTHRNLVFARRMFRRALSSENITELAWEEAMYHLAVAAVDSGKTRLAVPLLIRASADGDYPEAALLLNQIRTKQSIRPCRCRRHLDKHLSGHAKCPVHSPVGKLRTPANTLTG